ncbi:MAG: hypothetical protein ACI8WB_002621 [Phenylobacterium sp.]|jgi:hypothetical protein
MKRLTIGMIAVIAVIMFSTVMMTEKVNQNIASELKTTPPAAAVKPAKPARQITTRVEQVGLNAQQQQSLQGVKAAYGQQRKHLLQQRKQLSGEDYRQQLKQIKAQHQQQLAGLMSEQQYRLYHQHASRKRATRDKHLEKERETHRH